MKIRVGIIGYGNLGKAVEQELLKNKKFKLVAIFSRRVVTSSYNSLVERFEDYIYYKGKIDLMFMCGGSANDIEPILPEISKYFCTINSFDTHSKLQRLVSEVDKINRASKTVSLSACGWDPGLFSMIRSLMFAISGEYPTTFWGKGISMGHSDAIRKVDGVLDGVQFTVPRKEAVMLAKKNKVNDDIALHNRECFVVCDESKRQSIENQIKNIPNYFKGQPTSVEFVSSAEIAKLKRKMSHKGNIFMPMKLGLSQKASMEFIVKMDSNPAFTAKIMARFALAVINLKNEKRFGAYLPIDISISQLFSIKEREFIVKHLC